MQKTDGLSKRELLAHCATLSGLIQANTLPRPDCGICSNLNALVRFGRGHKVLRQFFEETGRDANYPVETAMFPDQGEDEIDNTYISDALNGRLWLGMARECRINLLNEFMAWLEERDE